MIIKARDLEDVFLFLFDDISISTRYKRVMATTLPLPSTVPNTSLVVLVFFISLALVGGRLLGMLATKYINKNSINGLILPRILFFSCPLLLEIL